MSRSALALIGSVLAVGIAVAGCSAAPPPAPAAPPAAAPTAAAPEQQGGHGAREGHGSSSAVPALYAVQSGPLGVVATDGGGHLMYRSDKDSAAPSASTCTGPCTETWIPVLVAPGQEPELLGVDKAAVGRLARPEGTSQLTLAGWPLYRHRDDVGGLQSTGHHGEDGTWFAVTPTGDKATAS